MADLRVIKRCRTTTHGLGRGCMHQRMHFFYAGMHKFYERHQTNANFFAVPVNTDLSWLCECRGAHLF